MNIKKAIEVLDELSTFSESGDVTFYELSRVLLALDDEPVTHKDMWQRMDAIVSVTDREIEDIERRVGELEKWKLFCEEQANMFKMDVKVFEPSEAVHDEGIRVGTATLYPQKSSPEVKEEKPCEYCSDQEWSREHECDCKDTITIPRKVAEEWLLWMNGAENNMSKAIKSALGER